MVGIELVEETVAFARENTKLNGIENWELLEGDILEQVDTLT